MSFEVNVITPFSGVKLEIGGAVETYWKSLAMPVPGASSAKLLSPRPPQHGRALGSAQTSPSNPTLSVASGHSLTHSSVTGSYIYVTVQVTRDLHPVVFAGWKLPDDHYDLGVADVTLAQFQSLAARLGRDGVFSDMTASPSHWGRRIAMSMVTLQDLLRVCRAPVLSGLLTNRRYRLYPRRSASAWS